MKESIHNGLRRLRCFLKSLIGKDIFYRTQVKRPIAFLGGRSETGYGAWGVASESLGTNSIVYSVGIGDDISFDLDLIRKFGAKVHAFDPTPESIEWLSRQVLPPQFISYEFGLADYDGTANFYAHENPEWISHSMLKTSHTVEEPTPVQVRRIATIMEMLGHNRVDLLKIDIEGAEYGLIDDIVSSGADIDQILVEFHHRFVELNVDMTHVAIKKLNDAGYKILYVSPRGEEFSFMKSPPRT